MTEWYDNHPKIANLISHIQDEGTFEEIGNGYIKAGDFKDHGLYEEIFEALSRLDEIHTAFVNQEGVLFEAVNKFLPKDERL